jgi:hypothetical protein
MNGDKKTPRPTVRTSAGQTDYKRELAYGHLGINPKDVQRFPFFGTQLRRIVRRINTDVGKDNPPSSRVHALDCLRSSEDPDARKVLNFYFSVPRSYRRLLPAEAFCHAAGVSPWRILECITVAAVRLGAMGSAIVAAITHPRVVQKTIERALQDDDIRERTILHKATGFIPSRG